MVPEISFYHLMSLPIERALPRLLEKVYASGAKALLFFDDEEKLKIIDDALWTYAQMDFLPHGTNKEAYPSLQPIYLTTDHENPNNATILVSIGNTQHPQTESFARVIDMFEDSDLSSVQSARTRYKKYKSLGYTLTYWKQDANGKWEKQG